MPSRELKAKENVVVYIRPEDVDIITEARASSYRNTLTGRIESRGFLGARTRLTVNIGKSTALKVDVNDSTRFGYVNALGKNVSLGFNECGLLSR
jgi:ABC-type Fe3+/spermidine/putrescine transport system ATPase subunit